MSWAGTRGSGQGLVWCHSPYLAAFAAAAGDTPVEADGTHEVLSPLPGVMSILPHILPAQDCLYPFLIHPVLQCRELCSRDHSGSRSE